MRIGELARVTGCTPRALRHYEQHGLITSARAANGYREYDEREVTRVRNIRYLLGAGLTLEDVLVFLPCLDGDVAAVPPSPAGLRVGRERLAVLDARIAAQMAARDRLAAALRDAAAALAEPGCEKRPASPPAVSPHPAVPASDAH
ncbi:MerR family transcriptional regulator [Micromonospora sp. KC721]|uniref:MerR family transcriptional regulator n=1 Tax=Micromonospora sp. KC721 TaxID=2530380 RepID=UPI001051ACF9|nr:MerR family transcriptional regulator [Micromonospora sp. KC721]TDB77266.1 MerR family transcriptional regulator [Micromonospora sp. KC721]